MKKLTEAQKRRLKTDRLIDRIYLFSGILFFGIVSWVAFNNYYGYDIRKNLLLAKFENKEIKGQRICMYWNKLNVGTSIPVVIDGETYYVCCQGCADKLKQNYRDSQYGEDKFSHHRIKKTKAFIVLQKGSNGKVSYFESEENFNHLK
jgi:YHS domain-containing protein